VLRVSRSGQSQKRDHRRGVENPHVHAPLSTAAIGLDITFANRIIR